MAGSRWVRLDTGYFTNPKITAVDRDSMLMHLASIAWCADQLTDGKVSPGVLPILTAMARVKGPGDRQIERLIGAGLYVPNGEGWVLHDFVEMNRQATREAVEQERRGWAERKARSRESRKGHGVT
jgi:hypothetical protein